MSVFKMKPQYSVYCYYLKITCGLIRHIWLILRVYSTGMIEKQKTSAHLDWASNVVQMSLIDNQAERWAGILLYLLICERVGWELIRPVTHFKMKCIVMQIHSCYVSLWTNKREQKNAELLATIYFCLFKLHLIKRSLSAGQTTVITR